MQNTLWQSFDFRDTTKTFDYNALSICVFSFYCHCAAGLHKTLLSKYAMTLKINILKKVAKRCKIEARNIDNNIWWQRRFWSHASVTFWYESVIIENVLNCEISFHFHLANTVDVSIYDFKWLVKIPSNEYSWQSNIATFKITKHQSLHIIYIISCYVNVMKCCIYTLHVAFFPLVARISKNFAKNLCR